MTRQDNQTVNRHTVRRLLAYAKPYTGTFIFVLILSLLTVVLELYQPKIIEAAANMITYKTGTGRDVLMLGVQYLVTAAATFGLTYVQITTLSVTGQKIIYNLRTDIFRHMTTLDMSFFNDNPIGRLVTRVTNDCETVNEMFTSVIVNLVSSSCVLVGVMIIMLKDHAGLSLAIFSVIPLIFVTTVLFAKFTRKFYREIRARISESNSFVAEHVSGMKIVQIFTAEEDMNREFEGQSEELRKANLKQLLVFAIYSPLHTILNIMSLTILLIYGGKLVASGTILVGTIIAFQQYTQKFFNPIQELAENFNIIQSAAAAAERIFWIMDTQPEICDDKNAVSADRFEGHIEFKNVWFAYKKGEWVLKDVSFEVKPGQKVAFVGETGAGKTTIQNLIGRYYDVQKGQILIDGIDVRKIKLSDLRRNVGQMLQDVFLFAGDIKSNIRLNNTEISDKEIVDAAKYVNAHGFISKLDGGYSHQVIERGAAFSAGQRQLLSFARTLAFSPSVLILDEATANIDTETEALIQDALGKLMEGRTNIVVAHRLSTIQNCDKIIVMHKGEVVEEGSHQELLAKGGTYYKLYKLQYEHEEEVRQNK